MKQFSQKTAIYEKPKIFKAYLPQRAPRLQTDLGSKSNRQMLTINKCALSVRITFFSFFESYTSIILMFRISKFCKEDLLKTTGL